MMFSLCMMCSRCLKHVKAHAQIERSEGEARSEEFALKCGEICVGKNVGEQTVLFVHSCCACSVRTQQLDTA